MKSSPELNPLAPRPNLDFSEGVRGKHFDRMQQGANAVLIAPDLLDTFPDSESVNEALGSLKKIAIRMVTPTRADAREPPPCNKSVDVSTDTMIFSTDKMIFLKHRDVRSLQRTLCFLEVLRCTWSTVVYN